MANKPLVLHLDDIKCFDNRYCSGYGRTVGRTSQCCFGIQGPTSRPPFNGAELQPAEPAEGLQPAEELQAAEELQPADSLDAEIFSMNHAYRIGNGPCTPW